MKIVQLLMVAAIAVFFNSCSTGQTEGNAVFELINAADFAKKMNEKSDAPIVDVRTPGEYAEGHIENSLNFNWNGSDFESQIATLDKSQPVFVYCMSGGRSASAVSKMEELGFEEVYELDGGMISWRSSRLPETTQGTKKSAGMSRADFDAMIAKSDKFVLVDFYAEWCAPCKKMAPYLAEIATDMASTVEVVKIDADKNAELCTQLKVNALPTLMLFKNNELIWSNVGFLPKEEVVNQLK